MRLMLALLLAIALPACACPELRERWDTPEETLAQWQARLCRDDVQGEYRCFSTSFQHDNGAFDGYFTARAALLRDHPGTAFLLRHADLSDHAAPTRYATDGRSATIVLDAHGEQLAIDFQCEAWVTVTFADGSSASVRQGRAPAALLGAGSGRQWLTFDRPPVADESRLADVRSLHVDGRWLISAISGLADPSHPSTDNSLRNSP
jgi:hypothetical protein